MSLFDQIRKEAGVLLGAQEGADAEAGQEPASSSGLGRMVAGLLRSEGLAQIVDRLRQKGLGDVVGSWIGHGENQPISPDQILHGLGPELIEKLSAKLGLPPGEVTALLSRFLPGVVDRLTPQGTEQELQTAGVAEPSEADDSRTEN